MKTVHGEAAYRNKKHKGLNNVKHNGCNKVSSSTGNSTITTSAIVHQQPTNSNTSVSMQTGDRFATGLRSVKSEFNSNGLDNHIQSTVQMETAALLGNGPPTLNSMNTYLNSNNNGSPSRQISGQFESGLINYDQGTSSFPASNHLNSTSLANHLTTKNEPSQFNDLNNYNYYNSYGTANLLESQQSLISDNKVSTTSLDDTNKTQSTNWTPGQLTNHHFNSNNYNDPMISTSNYNTANDQQSTLMPPPPPSSSNQATMHNMQSNYHLNQSNASLNKSQCLAVNEVDEGIGSESVTEATDDDEPSQRVLNSMMMPHYASGGVAGDSMMIMTQHHQPLTRASIKSNRPSLKNRLRNGIKSWIPNIFHKNTSTGNNACQKNQTDYNQQYDTSYVEPNSTTTAQLDSLNCSNYQPMNSTCSSRQSAASKKKSKDGNSSSLSLKVPFLSKNRKSKTYEETGKECKDAQALNQQQAASTLEDQLDLLPDEVMHFLKENKDDQQQTVHLPAGPLSPNSSMITQQLSPAHRSNNDCNVKLTQLNCVQQSNKTNSKQDSLTTAKTSSSLNNASNQQPFSPMSINSSPNTPGTIINNPLSPMVTDPLPNLNSNNSMNTSVAANKPPPPYAFATAQQLNQQQQQVDQCNSFNNTQPTYQSYNASSYNNQNYTNYNQNDHSTNYYTSNYVNQNSSTNVPNDYNQPIKTEINNGCTSNMSRIHKYVNNQNINIYLNGQSQSNHHHMMPQSTFYNHPIYVNNHQTQSQNSFNNSYSNWQQPVHNQPQSRQASAMSIDTNNNSSTGNQNNAYCKYNSYHQNNMMPPPITYSQQLSSQLTPPIPSSLLMNQASNSMQMNNLNEMCSPRPMSAVMNRCESRCDSRSRLMSPMQICNDQPIDNMVINDMSSGLSSLAEENLILKMRSK